MTKTAFLGLLPETVADQFTQANKKSYVAKQVLTWVYQSQVTDIAGMTNVSKKDREWLSETYDFMPLELVQRLPAADKTAIKYIFKLSDGNTIESVVLNEKTYQTLCISSQCGCGINCQFCLTGVSGLRRNLTVAEIVAQVMAVNQDGNKISRLVFMGMGEPMANVDNVLAAIGIISHDNALNISKRKITVSTSGILGGIQKLIDNGIYLNLAFSVGHPDPEKRESVMPIEKTNPIAKVSQLLHTYLKQHNRKLTLEYTLLQGVNDDTQAIRELINLARFLNAKVNLINLNPHKRIPYKPISSTAMANIKHQIDVADVPVTIRFTKGQDVVAACGQLGESLLKAQ